MNNQICGIIELTIDGIPIEVDGDVTINIGKIKNEGKTGPTGNSGYKALYTIPFLSCSVRDTRTLDTNRLMSITDSTILAKLANGKLAIFNHAYWAGEGDINSGEGTIAAKFESISADYIKQ